MPIAEHPLHRSGRADFPHPAPTSGNDAKPAERIRDDRHVRVATSGRYTAASAPTSGERAGSAAAACGITRQPTCERKVNSA